MLLERINEPNDLKKLTINELEALSQEIRERIIEVVSKNGGHLASNLGVVELTLAIHRVFNSPVDDPPWQFNNRTGKVAPEHKRLNRYPTLPLEDIKRIPVQTVVADHCHLYLWVPNALLPDGLAVMRAWGFEYKTNLIWEKVRKDGYPDGRGVGFYFRNVTEILLFGIRGSGYRTLPPARSQVNIIRSMKREHSKKPDEIYNIIESCSEGDYLEMFARGVRPKWIMWGNQATESYAPDWATYKQASVSLEMTNDLFHIS